MDSVLDYIETLEDLIDGGKGVPFSNKVSLDKAEIFDLLNDMRLNLPAEIRNAQKVIDDHDRILNDAKSKAAAMLKNAEDTAREMTFETEIFKRAKEEGEIEVEEARRYAREIRTSALEYAEGLMTEAEETLRRVVSTMNLTNQAIEDSLGDMIKEIYENLQELRQRSANLTHTGSQRTVDHVIEE